MRQTIYREVKVQRVFQELGRNAIGPGAVMEAAVQRNPNNAYCSCIEMNSSVLGGLAHIVGRINNFDDTVLDDDEITMEVFEERGIPKCWTCSLVRKKKRTGFRSFSDHWWVEGFGPEKIILFDAWRNLIPSDPSTANTDYNLWASTERRNNNIGLGRISHNTCNGLILANSEFREGATWPGDRVVE